ncbi:MAG: M23 family metallopeptidase [Deltaproteobacteria bacterium]|nr:M23 family metallopeptidase [Deltaproteobacteria bacterium]
MAGKFKTSRATYAAAIIILCGFGVAVTWLCTTKLEREVPRLVLKKAIHSIGASCTLEAVASDEKSGLKRVWIAILQGGKEVTLFDQKFPSVGFFGGSSLRKQPVCIEIKPHELDLKDGEAVLRTRVWDYSWWRWMSGNRFYAEHNLVIDTKAPEIDVLTRNHYLNQGGAGLIIYRISESVAKSGVNVGKRFFPGSSGYFADPDIFIAFFAIPYDVGPDAQLYITATDLAGNTSRMGFSYHINRKRFKKDIINVPDAFLKRKMPEFEHFIGKEKSSAPLIDKFLTVNRDVRRLSNKTIVDTCKKSDPRLYWKGKFLRLPASARKAGFADYRLYRHRGDVIDKQVHMGVDLASTAHSAIPAANNGRVAFCDELGIYGKSVIIDHGFGLFSIYGHLSRIQVTRGQMVSKGDIIGFTGSTGLAGGDHLHFAMMIHNTFVNPVEWWDSNWIKHNVIDKLKVSKVS